MGKGQPPSLELRPGVELAPLSVGTGGAWQITAPGVRQVHLYLYFDGEVLYVQSASAEDPPRVNDQLAPDTWTALSGECNIAFGQARLVFRPADLSTEEDPTVADDLPANLREELLRAEEMPTPPPPPRRPGSMPARPFKPGAFARRVDDESTRLQPFEDRSSDSDSTRVEPLLEPSAEPRGPPLPASVRPAAGAPWTVTQPLGQRSPQAFPAGSPPAFTPPPQTTPNGPPSGLLNVPPPSVRKPPPQETAGQKLKREWAAMPPLRRGLLAALPFGLLVLAWITYGGSPTAPPTKSVVAADPTGAGSGGTQMAPPIPGTGQGMPMGAASTATPAPPVPAQPTVPTSSPSGPTPPGTPALAAPSTITADAGNVDRRERQAADLVAMHSYPEAIRVYEALAAERPQNPAFAEAARILRAKISSGVP